MTKKKLKGVSSWDLFVIVCITMTSGFFGVSFLLGFITKDIMYYNVAIVFFAAFVALITLDVAGYLNGN